MQYALKPERLGIYLNTKRLTIDQIKAETKADVIINGGLFNGDWTACCHLKVDGKVIASDPWKYFGYGWHKNDIRLTTEYSDLDNYICCVCLIRDGKAETLLYPNEMGGARPRTALGVYSDGRVWFYASGDKLTPENLQKYCLSLGLDSALMMDGGGSSQGISPNGSYRQTRKCHNYILAWERSSCPYPEPSGLICRGNRGEGVKWLQYMLNRHGASLEIDGIYGGKTYAAVVTFQSSHGLAPDGVVGNLTKAKLRGENSAPAIIQPDYIWARTPSKRSRTDYIILHHAGVASATPESIHTYHKSLGWCGIGYNVYVRKDGRIYQGRPMGAVGAHTVGYNDKSVGLCFEGNFEQEQMTTTQIEAGRRAVQMVRALYPSAAIKLHRECDATACPGAKFPVEEFR